VVIAETAPRGTKKHPPRVRITLGKQAKLSKYQQANFLLEPAFFFAGEIVFVSIRRFSAAFCGLALLCYMPHPVVAGAFLTPPGQGEIIAATEFSDSARAFDKNGKLIPVPSYRKFELKTYADYGLTEWLTLITQPTFDHVQTKGHSSHPNGRQFATDIGARIGFFRSAATIVSVQSILHIPEIGASNGARVQSRFDGKRDFTRDLRLMVGQTFTCADMQGFGEISAGHRWRGTGWPNEWRIDFGLGLRPMPPLLILAQSFSALAESGTKSYPHYFWHKLQFSTVYDVQRDWSLQIGGFLTVAGLNAGREFGPVGGIWYRF
jgi:hypothetical protein